MPVSNIDINNVAIYSRKSAIQISLLFKSLLIEFGVNQESVPERLEKMKDEASGTIQKTEPYKIPIDEIQEWSYE